MYIQFKVEDQSVQLTNNKLTYAYVMLFDEAGNWRTRLYFVPQPEVNGYTNVTINGDFIELYMNIKLLNDVGEILRNEKPLTASANFDYNTFILGAGKEPVGEGG